MRHYVFKLHSPQTLVGIRDEQSALQVDVKHQLEDAVHLRFTHSICHLSPDTHQKARLLVLVSK